MGFFDTVLVPCPKCSTLYSAQSKSGDCMLDYFDLPTPDAKNPAPAHVMRDVNRHAPFTCTKCSTVFYVKTIKEPVYIPGEYAMVEIQEDDTDGV